MRKLLLSLFTLFIVGTLAANAATETLKYTDFTNSSSTGYATQRTYSSSASGLSYKIGASINSNRFQQSKSKGCFFEITANDNNVIIKSVKLVSCNSNYQDSYLVGHANSSALSTGVTAGSGTGKFSDGTNVTCSNGVFTPNDKFFSYYVKSTAIYFQFESIEITYEEATVPDAPTLTTDTKELDFGSVAKDATKDNAGSVTAANLTAGITLEISGTNADMFSVTPATLTTAGGDFTVTYTPTAYGSHSATLTISSTDAESITIPLSGSCPDPDAPQPTTATAQIIMANQGWTAGASKLYANGKTINWVSEDKKVTFTTSATVSVNSNYPAYFDGHGLRLYPASHNVITVNAPDGYHFVNVTPEYSANTVKFSEDKNSYSDAIANGETYNFSNKPSVIYITPSTTSTDNKPNITAITFVIEKDGATPPSPEKPAKPTFDPASGATLTLVDGKVTVTVNCATEGATATILYDEEYIEDVAFPYVITFDKTGSHTVIASASLNGQNSEDAEASYTVVAPTPAKPATPTFDQPDEAELVLENGKATVTVACTTEGATGTATYGGNTYSIDKFPYVITFTTEDIYTVEVIATKDGVDSDKATATYYVENPDPNKPAAPTFSPASGTELTLADGKATVTVNCTTEGATGEYEVDGPGYDSGKTFDIASFPHEITFTQNGTYKIIVFSNSNNVTSDIAEATYTVVGPSAPVITFSQTGGVFSENDEFEVTLNVTGYPAPEVYYTVDGYKAHGTAHGTVEHVMKYDGTPIKVSATASGVAAHPGAMTINVYAKNSVGEALAAETYTFVEPKWVAVTSVDELTDGMQVVWVSQRFGYIMNNTANTNARKADTEVEFTDETRQQLASLPANALFVTLEKDATHGWRFKVGEDQYLYSDGGTSSNHLKIHSLPADYDGQYYATISMAEDGQYSGCANIDFNFSGRNSVLINLNKSKDVANPLISCYERSAHNPATSDTYGYVSIFKQVAATTETPEELFLVMDNNENDGYRQEVAHPFEYKGGGVYELNIADIAVEGSHYNKDGQWELYKNGIAGYFYIRDGKADNTGTVFGPDASQLKYGGTPAPANAPRKAEGEYTDPYVYPQDDYVQLALDGNTGNSPAYTLVKNPDHNYKFATDEDRRTGNYTTFNAGTLRVNYTPGSDAATMQVLEVGEGGTTGVATITADDAANDADAEYYNLQGIKVPAQNLTPGFYIRRTPANSSKIYIR